MKSIMPIYLVIIGFAIMMVMATSMIMMQLQFTSARELHTECLTAIQASNYSESVITAMEQHVKDKNDEWTLTVTNDKMFDDRKAYLIKLDYTVTAPLLGVNNQKASIAGYGK